MDDITLRLENIQGNVLAGFNKDFQSFLFLKVVDKQQARAWLQRIMLEVATCDEVGRFNELFRTVVKRRRQELGIVKATWMNLAFTHVGLRELGVPDGDLGTFPQAFREGMRARAVALGDVGPSAPDQWIDPFLADDVHILMIVASDSATDLHEHVLRYVSGAHQSVGVELLAIQEGATRVDEPGHEHFGFKDGVSQPGILGFTPHDPGAGPGEGHPGQDLLQPGEFVLGYPVQGSPVLSPDSSAAAIPTAGAPPALGYEAQPPVSSGGPSWTADGSFLVWRRLRQNVDGFQRQIQAQAGQLEMHPDVVGAKLVGRYKSGCPLERTNSQSEHDPDFDPTLEDPAILDPSTLQDSQINNFGYSGDPDGVRVPRAAHIRKAYPRDQTVPGEDAAQRHRLLRRGIAFGTSFRPTPGTSRHSVAGIRDPLGNDRGLLFLSYQSDIERQFEFVQGAWVNNASFPTTGDGEDPIIAQSISGPFRLPDNDPSDTVTPTMQHFVTTTGGAYFFTPSISALTQLSGA